ncbi:MAG: hypothetical protein IRZ16_06335 [Myxococcaceae bacterium]|nr:hypothetical protein [Myxococcaceae bacterium]
MVNPYDGCEFACTHCPARMDFKETVDWRAFETQIRVRTNAAEALLRDLHASDFERRQVVLGGSGDPWQQAEEHFRVTRALLEAMARVEGVDLRINTRSSLIARDTDVLRRIGLLHPVDGRADQPPDGAACAVCLPPARRDGGTRESGHLGRSDGGPGDDGAGRRGDGPRDDDRPRRQRGRPLRRDEALRAVAGPARAVACARDGGIPGIGEPLPAGVWPPGAQRGRARHPVRSLRAALPEARPVADPRRGLHPRRTAARHCRTAQALRLRQTRLMRAQRPGSHPGHSGQWQDAALK